MPMNLKKLVNVMDYEEEIDIDLIPYEIERKSEERECNCSNCMDCLGFSWRDFF